MGVWLPYRAAAAAPGVTLWVSHPRIHRVRTSASKWSFQFLVLISPFKSKNLFNIFHITKTKHKKGTIFFLLDKTILDVFLSKILDPFMFFSCFTLTWSKDKNTNN